jgi:hypothetical protein
MRGLEPFAKVLYRGGWVGGIDKIGPPQLGVEALPPELELEMRRAMSLTPSIQEAAHALSPFYH